jgi:hypothetical protein
MVVDKVYRVSFTRWEILTKKLRTIGIAPTSLDSHHVH